MEQTQCIAAKIVGRVLSGRSLDDMLAATWRDERSLNQGQRGAIQDMAYGTLRHLGRIDVIINQLLRQPVTDSLVRNLLQVAVYQLVHTKARAYTIVDHAVPACARLGFPRAGGLVNAVLRNFLRRRAELEAAASATGYGRYSYPQWWIDKLAAQHPDHYRSMLEAGNMRPSLTLRVNRRRMARDTYLEMLERDSIAARPVGTSGVIIEKPRPVSELPGFAEGTVSVQDAGAQLAAELLDVRYGMRVLDACAAPGGKAAHLLEIADIYLVAADIESRRLQKVADNLKRLALKAELREIDATQPEQWPSTDRFDRILADVPCTASGIVRRHPDIKWLRKPVDIKALANRQSLMLDTLWQMLGRGGKLLYATCSVFSEENSRQVEQFIARSPDARQCSLPSVADDLNPVHGQLFPDAAHDGFYYALLEKI